MIKAVASSRSFPPNGFLMTGASTVLLFTLADFAPREMAVLPGVVAGAFLLVLTMLWPLEVIITVYSFTWQLMALHVPLPFAGDLAISLERLFALIAAPGLILGLATGRVRLRPIPLWLKASTGTLMLVYLVSVLIHGSGVGAFLQVVQKVGLAFMAFAAVTDETMARGAMRMLLLGCVAASLAVFGLVLIGGDLDALIMTRGERQILIVDSFFEVAWVNAARVAHLGQFGVWLALVEAGMSTTRRRRVVWTALAAGLLVAQTLVFRRMVLLSAVLALLFLTVYRRTKVRAMAATILALSALMFGALIFPNSEYWQYRLGYSQAYLYRIGGQVIPAVSGGPDPRAQLFVVSWRTWSDAPVLGHGLDQFGTAVRRYEAVLSAWEDPSVPIAAHNSFAMIAVELGALGLLAVLFFLGTFIRELWAADRRRAPGYLGQLMAMWPVLFGQVILWWLLGNAFYLNLSWFLFGALLGAACLARSAASTASEKR